MRSKPKEPLPPGTPDTGYLVSVELQRKAMRLFRNAGRGGLTREELAEGLGVGTRQADRAVEHLEAQGAVIHRRWMAVGPMERMKLLTLERGPDWDELPSPLAGAVLELAQLPPEKVGGPLWVALLHQIHEAAHHHLTFADRHVFAQLVAGIPTPQAIPPFKPGVPIQRGRRARRNRPAPEAETPAPKPRHGPKPGPTRKVRKTPSE